MCICIYASYEAPKCLPHANVKNNNGQFENLCCYAYGFVVIICGRGESREKLRGVGKMGERERDSGKHP